MQRVLLFWGHSLFWPDPNGPWQSSIQAGTAEGLALASPLWDYLSRSYELVLVAANGRVFDRQLPPSIDVVYFDTAGELYRYVEHTPPVAAILWNGTDLASTIFVNWIKALAGKVLTLEYGLFPQGEFIKIEAGGVLAAADAPPQQLLESIQSPAVDEYLTSLRLPYDMAPVSFPNSINSQNALLVLQTDYDSSIALGSPFPELKVFINYLVSSGFDFSKVSVRKHPKMPSEDFVSAFNDISQVCIDDSPTPIHALTKYSIFFGLNSTLMYEAVLLGKPVVNFGTMYGMNGFTLSGYEYLRSGLDSKHWESTRRSRELIVYFMHRFRQFSVTGPLSETFVRYLKTLLPT
ncbi:MAG: hypothetical protein Q8R72_15880 [Hylemonella sp.]|nr:hypothetical protein [Hylemonella sp.]